MDGERQERAERLRKAVGSEWSLTGLARHLDVPASTFSSYVKKGTIPPFDVGNGICKALRITPEWYLFGEGEMRVSGDIRKTEDFDVISNETLRNEREEFERIGETFGYRNAGEAMSPTIPSGAKIVFRKMSERDIIEDACVYLLRLKDGLAVRRLQRSVSGGFMSVCDNPAFVIEKLPDDAKPIAKAMRIEIDL
ncbi:LexA family transcriptional regulator [Roseibium sp. RKSG952]|uniref:XRE family transcriptional regulator n=1 Tax=Roseibium sp. RKSG952 TaxID=2529384 RepID=UPI0012BBB763|nr:LexA family transcriptional regulator [Roseibium sp. RKSG952]MTH95397.1 hypothetical protein [Roseibium sp. RKSG952]